MKKTKKIILSISGFILFLLAAWSINWWYHAKLIFNDANDLQRDSYEFNLLVSDSMKKMPAHNPITGTVKYHYNAGGAIGTSDELRFNTLLPPETIFKFYKGYFESNGYISKHPDYVTQKNIIYGNDDHTFNVYIEILDNNEYSVGILHDERYR